MYNNICVYVHVRHAYTYTYTQTCMYRYLFTTDMYVHCVYRYGALSSLEGLVQYLGVHTNPADAAFCPDHRAQLCYIAHVIAVVLKNSVSSSDGQTSVQVHTINVYYSCVHILDSCINIHVYSMPDLL